MPKIRPELRAGDIVKLSKKGRKFPRNFSINTTMIVSDVIGLDSEEKSCIIKCRIKTVAGFETHKFYRSELWATGKNAFV